MSSATGTPGGTPLRLSRLRRTIGRRLRESVTTKPPVTLHTTAPADALRVALQSERAAGRQASLTALVGLATARSLLAHRDLNGFAFDDEVRLFDEVHLGIAVDTPGGLIVPVVRDAHLLRAAELATAIEGMAEKTRSGALEPTDVLDATFTITSLGVYGVEQFTPIVNPPQIAVLGIGALRPVPSLGEDGWRESYVLHLSLTFDHAAVDGAPAARFLADLVEALQDPLGTKTAASTSKETG